MNFIKDGVYPISEQQIRANHPNTSFPRPMELRHVADFGYELVHEAAPTYNPATEKVTENAPVFANGQWTQSWTVSPKWETLAAAKAELKARAAEKRWQVEMGGTTISGMPVVTDATSQAKLTGALNFVGRKPNRVIKWKMSNGEFASLTKAQIEALSEGAGEFVASCFDAEAAHVAAIDALASITACQAYDITTGWPT